jgi:hypothetical protein
MSHQRFDGSGDRRSRRLCRHQTEQHGKADHDPDRGVDQRVKDGCAAEPPPMPPTIKGA